MDVRSSAVIKRAWKDCTKGAFAKREHEKKDLSHGRLNLSSSWYIVHGLEMKRALAERAKQSIPQGQHQVVAAGGGSGSLSSSPEISTKIPRLEEPPKLNSDQIMAFGAPSGSTSAELRASKIHALTENVADEDNTSAFYLRHQNRAMATELKSLQHLVSALETEREHRRHHCLAACQALISLQATWTQLETALSGGKDSTTCDSSMPSVESSDGTPPSTGSKSAEWTLVLARALAALGNSPHEGRKDPMETDEKIRGAVSLDHFYMDLTKVSANVASRASTLQEWIWKVLQDGGQSQGSSLDIADLEKSVALAQAEKTMLESKLAEMSSSRDDALSRERKLRRNLYRLASGILTTAQVMKSVDDGNDEVLVAEVRKETEAILEAKEAKKKVKEDPDTPGSSVTPAIAIEQVEKYETRIAELQQTIERREESLREVRICLCIVDESFVLQISYTCLVVVLCLLLLCFNQTGERSSTTKRIENQQTFELATI